MADAVCNNTVPFVAELADVVAVDSLERYSQESCFLFPVNYGRLGQD